MKPESLKALGAIPLDPPGRLAEFRSQLPGAVEKITELIVDNPAQFGLIAGSGCGSGT